jgi:hypothetical protein
VITFSGNAIIGPTIGAVKPYFGLGAGNLNLNVTSLSSIVVPNPTNISSNYFTFNVGGGVMGFFGSHWGVRGDLRYFRAFGFKLTDLETAGLQLDRFDFWRASIPAANPDRQLTLTLTFNFCSDFCFRLQLRQLTSDFRLKKRARLPLVRRPGPVSYKRRA